MEKLLEMNVDDLSVSDKIDYYCKLKNECLKIKNTQLQIGQNIIHTVYPVLRNYKFEIQGEENIPVDSNAMFLVNHSNSHDIFTAYEVLSSLHRNCSVMVATDCLNPFTIGIFNISNATLLDRRNKTERFNSILNLSSKVMRGNDGVVFGESTWNIHPTLPMHNIRQGISKISLITQVPIIPTIFEYLEEDGILKTESKLYKKCIIRFGNPIIINYEENLIDQTNNLKNIMTKMRKQVWCDYNINRYKLSDINPKIYINHTYLKKFNAFGFTYDSKKEEEFLLFLKDEPVENEYTITKDGIFCPGITEKQYKLRKKLSK